MHKTIGDLYESNKTYKLDVSEIETFEDVKEVFKLLNISVNQRFIDQNKNANKFFKEHLND